MLGGLSLPESGKFANPGSAQLPGISSREHTRSGHVYTKDADQVEGEYGVVETSGGVYWGGANGWKPAGRKAQSSGRIGRASKAGIRG